MLTQLILVCCFSVLISALCSLAESALFSVPLGAVRASSDNGKKSAKILLKLKEDMSDPIASILILNTVAHTAGASMAGAIVGNLYGDGGLFWFSVIFTLAILYLSEIIPKQIGVIYSKEVAPLLAYPLFVLIKLLYPAIVMTKFVDHLLKRGDEAPKVTESEVLSIAKIGTEEGVLQPMTGKLISNAIHMRTRLVRDFLTPRVVVFRLDASTTFDEIKESLQDWNHTRIPIFDKSNPDYMTGFVHQKDIFRNLIKNDQNRSLSDFSRSITTVPETMTGEQVITHFFEKREHIVAVVDEHGAFVGVVTLEDVLEELLGNEIVDEYDLVSDLREYAKVLHEKKILQSQIHTGQAGQST